MCNFTISIRNACIDKKYPLLSCRFLCDLFLAFSCCSLRHYRRAFLRPHPLQTLAPVIIIKVDDLKSDAHGGVPDRWQRFVDYIKEHKLHAGKVALISSANPYVYQLRLSTYRELNASSQNCFLCPKVRDQFVDGLE